MRKDDSFKKASLNAHKTMALLEDRQIRKVPQNYTIWYEYLSEENPAVKEAVNRLMHEKGKFNDDVAKQIYNEFFSHEREGKAIRETNRLVQKSMEAVLRELRASSSGLSDYSDKLEDFADNVGGLTEEDFQETVRQVIGETRDMSQRSQHLNESLNKATAEIDDLRKRLESVEQEVLTDPLTGIANRKRFDEELLQATKNAIKNKTKLCLVMSDIDHFKKFNDTHGHLFGDQVLKLVANTLSTGVEKSAVTARYGGEEFGIILPGTAITHAIQIANRLRESVSSKKLVKRTTGDDVGKITMSFGVAQFNYDEDPMVLVSRADTALYDAKEAGRDQVKYEMPQFARTA
ncbi:MAG: diguanylate cyclase [Lentilitoribacter sp.]